jgi:hypothetical protein
MQAGKHHHHHHHHQISRSKVRMPSFARSFQYKVVCNCGESHQIVLFPYVSHWQTDLGTILQESKKKTNTNPLAKIPLAAQTLIL